MIIYLITHLGIISIKFNVSKTQKLSRYIDKYKQYLTKEIQDCAEIFQDSALTNKLKIQT